MRLSLAGQVASAWATWGGRELDMSSTWGSYGQVGRGAQHRAQSGLVGSDPRGSAVQAGRGVSAETETKRPTREGEKGFKTKKQRHFFSARWRQIEK